ncbi:hypothetical protein WME75_21260 [Sorangium sp. So ce1014]
MSNKIETKVESNVEKTEAKPVATTESRAMRIRLKTGVMAGPVVAVHL